MQEPLVVEVPDLDGRVAASGCQIAAVGPAVRDRSQARVTMRCGRRALRREMRDDDHSVDTGPGDRSTEGRRVGKVTGIAAITECTLLLAFVNTPRPDRSMVVGPNETG